MKIAVIDIGTNTFNLLIASKPKNKLVLNKVTKEFVFLGKGGINKNIIQDDAILRAITTLKKFKVLCLENKVDSIHAIATSAVRNAKNKLSFVKQVFDETNIEVEIINGDAEAKFIYEGARESIDFKKKPILLMDIGGGSTEFIICNNQKIFWKKSFEIGAARLFEKYQKSDQITTSEIEEIEGHITNTLSPLFNIAQDFNMNTLVGSSGSFTSFAKIIANKLGKPDDLIKTSNYIFNIQEYNYIHESILNSTLKQRHNIKGLIKERAPMIVVGTVLVNFLLRKLKIEHFKLARYALKEGIASDFFKNN